MTADAKKGFVYLVGAGPGRPDLITVRGAEVLRRADCVICDKLTSPSLLNYVPTGAEIIHVPKRIGPGSFKQAQINKLLVERALDGKTVVRLKGGDPCVFGRGGEEATVLAEAGIEFEIVPGVTAGIAAGEYAGIMITDRRYSSQVAFVTGQEAEGKEQSNIDWPGLARFNGTIVFYMAMSNLNFIVEQLIKNGMDGNTPASVIADATLPVQKLAEGKVVKIVQLCQAENIEAPAIVIIGEAARSNKKLNWFMNQPLFGKTIVVTRDRRGNAEFAAKILTEGGNPFEFDTIRIESRTQSNEFLKTLAEIGKYDWVIFTSINGVRVFFEAVGKLGGDARVFGSAKIGAIGRETAGKLGEFGIKADFVPNDFTSAQLAKELAASVNLKGKRMLLLRSELGSDEIVENLRRTGAEVEDVAVYTSVTEKSDCKRLIDKINAGKIDWLTFCSPSSVRGFFEQIPPKALKSDIMKVASIGPVTSEQIRKLGVKIDLESGKHTIDGLLDGLKEFYK